MVELSNIEGGEVERSRDARTETSPSRALRTMSVWDYMYMPARYQL